MAVRYTDDEISSMLTERKPLPADWQTRIRLLSKSTHQERHLDVRGEHERVFRLILRKSLRDPMDFSVILAVREGASNRFFRLRRYNGKHQHSNSIESETFRDFHIHIATERYQRIGAREDHYARPTDRYGDYDKALKCLMKDANFEPPAGQSLDGAPSLFAESSP